jgi:hypothetical protein
MHACFAVYSQAMALVRRHLPMEFAMPNVSERQTHARTCGTRPSSLDGVTGQGPESPSLAKGVAGIIARLRKAGPSPIQIIGIVCNLQSATRCAKPLCEDTSHQSTTPILLPLFANARAACWWLPARDWRDVAAGRRRAGAAKRGPVANKASLNKNNRQASDTNLNLCTSATEAPTHAFEMLRRSC